MNNNTHNDAGAITAAATMSIDDSRDMLVFYNNKQCANEHVGYSPSAKKPQLVVSAWKKLSQSVTIKKVRPLSVDDIAAAHDPRYVRGVLSGKIKNGFGNKSLKVAKSLQWTTGSFLSAAVHAFQHKRDTFSPTSGFHHACYNHANGFCTFSGLTIAAVLLRRKYGAQHIGILDLDSHEGDGTDDTIHRTNSEDFITHYSLGYYDIQKHNNAEWLTNLPTLISQKFADCDVLFYQAGADCHEDDPEAHSGHFTTEQMYQRDKLVYSTCKQLRVPVVTNLAGGYQTPLQKVVDLHNLTASAFHECQLL